MEYDDFDRMAHRVEWIASRREIFDRMQEEWRHYFCSVTEKLLK